MDAYSECNYTTLAVHSTLVIDASPLWRRSGGQGGRERERAVRSITSLDLPKISWPAAAVYISHPFAFLLEARHGASEPVALVHLSTSPPPSPAEESRDKRRAEATCTCRESQHVMCTMSYRSFGYEWIKEKRRSQMRGGVKGKGKGKRKGRKHRQRLMRSQGVGGM
ncbi:hypothetical protein BHE74_00041921 [Ensete ventricosum]|nr:hypothetical protein BHE74_00041921 [Ensete ventricosum]